MSMPQTIKNTFTPLMTYLQEIYDPRDQKKIKYLLSEVVFIALAGLLSGQDDWVAIESYGKSRNRWLKKYFKLKCGIPSHDTFGHVFALIDPQELINALGKWLNNLISLPEQDIINIDGKLIESYSAADPFCLLKAWSSKMKIVLNQVKVPAYTNEIKAIPSLLDLIDIKGNIVTIDAIGAQKAIIKKICDKDGYYVIALKANQHRFYKDIKDYLISLANNEFDIPFSYHETINKSHGRTEIRRCWSIDQLDWLEQKSEWTGLKSIILVETEIIYRGKTTINRRFFISNLNSDATKFLHVIRSHWSIENQLHWHLDVTFHEDHSRVKDRFGIQNLSFLRAVAISLLSKIMKNLGFKRKRQIVNYRPSLLKKILLN